MLFDAHCMIGRRSQRSFCEPFATEDLLARMRQCGIDAALVRHAAAVEYDPACGNALLLDELRAHSQLKGIWVMAPHETAGLEPPEVFLKKMFAAGIRAVALCPKTQGYPLEYGCEEMLQALMAHRVPVFLSLPETDWPAVHGLLSSWPALRLILTDVSRWDRARFIYPLFKKFSELRVETSLLRTQMGLEDVCRRFGADRLLWGSGWPLLTPGASLGMLNYAFLDETQRAQIAGGTLTRLLEEVGTA